MPPPARPLEDERLVYGVHPMMEALEADPPKVDRIFVGRESGSRTGRLCRLGRERGVPVSHVDRETLRRRAVAGAVHQGVAAVLSAAPYARVIDHLAAARAAGDRALLVAVEGVDELFPADGPVKVKVVGNENEEVIKQGDRVKNYMNFLLTEGIEDYRDETEKLLFSLPQVGSAFKKVRIDHLTRMPCAEFVPAEDIVVNYGAKNLKSATRVTHIVKMPKQELIKAMASGFYRQTDLKDPVYYCSDIQEKKDKINGENRVGSQDDLYYLFEQHCYSDIETPDQELMQPYIITTTGA